MYPWVFWNSIISNSVPPGTLSCLSQIPADRWVSGVMDLQNGVRFPLAKILVKKRMFHVAEHNGGFQDKENPLWGHCSGGAGAQQCRCYHALWWSAALTSITAGWLMFRWIIFTMTSLWVLFSELDFWAWMCSYNNACCMWSCDRSLCFVVCKFLLLSLMAEQCWHWLPLH